jgi:hypothetical protein
MTYEILKDYYEKKLWNENLLKMAVRKGIITASEFLEITGNEYVAN